jgi:hypothetical protein
MSVRIQNRAHLAAAGLLAGGSFLYCFAPDEHSFYPRCLFHALTGWQCPGCGGTRALYHLLHLDFSQAMHCNGLVALLAPLALAAFIFWYVSLLRSGRTPALWLPPRVVACLSLAVTIFGFARNLAPFS